LVTVNGNSRGAGDGHLVFVQGHQDWIFRVMICTVPRPGYGVLEGVASVICIGIHAVFIPGESLRLLGVSRIFLTRLCTLPLSGYVWIERRTAGVPEPGLMGRRHGRSLPWA